MHLDCLGQKNNCIRFIYRSLASTLLSYRMDGKSNLLLSWTPSSFAWTSIQSVLSQSRGLNVWKVQHRQSASTISRTHQNNLDISKLSIIDNFFASIAHLLWRPFKNLLFFRLEDKRKRGYFLGTRNKSCKTNILY